MLPLFSYGGITSPQSLLIIGLIGLLLFGNRLPQVMRSLGKSVVEFKKGVNGIEDEINEAVKNADDKAKPKNEG